MTELQILDKKLVMDSRDIAELTGKHHKNIIRDIRNMLDLAGSKLSPLTYIDKQGKSRPYYLLDYENTLLLLTGYSVQLRQAVIKRWLYLEKIYRNEKSIAVEQRKIFTDDLKEHGYEKQIEYIQTTMQMKSALNISGKKDSIPASQVKAIRAAEALSVALIDNEFGYSEVNPVCVEAAETVANAINNKKAITA